MKKIDNSTNIIKKVGYLEDYWLKNVIWLANNDFLNLYI